MTIHGVSLKEIKCLEIKECILSPTMTTATYVDSMLIQLMFGSLKNLELRVTSWKNK
jgi:hypothetical protein